MRNSKLRIIVSGLMAQYPIGGVTWDYLQYVIGLARLGHDVYYIEDTGQCPYNPVERSISSECSYNVNYLSRIMSRFGLENKWAYHFLDKSHGKSEWYGLPSRSRNEVKKTADLVIDISCTLRILDDYKQSKRLVYVDTDPVFTQVKLARGQTDFRNRVDAYDVHFSYGERLATSGPETGHNWLPMRKPIILSQWNPSSSRRNVFTTVMNWSSYKPIQYNGRTYGQKDVEFMHFLELPEMVAPVVLEIALGPGKINKPPTELLAYKGWRVVDPMDVCSDFDDYRHYIESSKAEWTVAKNGYVQGQAGWFSERSACYLAASKPVIVQDTGFTQIIPAGKGVLAFRTIEEAVDAIKKVNADYDRHSKAARSVAEEFFDSDKVLAKLIDGAMDSNS